MNDKVKHLIVGFALGLSLLLLTLKIEIQYAVFINLLYSTLIFFGKEIYDMYKPNPTGFDALDLSADYIGWFVGILTASLIFAIL